MCNPLIMTALSVVQTVVEHQEQQAAYDRNVAAANNALRDDYTQLNTRQRQEQEKTAQEKLDKTLEGRKAEARNVASQGESGVALNFDSIASDIMRNVSFSNVTADANLAMTNQSLDDERRGARNRRTSRINEVPAPSLMGSGLKIAGSVASGASNAKKAGGWTGSSSTAASSSSSFTPYPGARSITRN